MSTRSLAGINRGQTLQEVVEAELGDLAEYENFDQVIQAVARAGAQTQGHIQQAGLGEVLGSTGEINVQGEVVQRLDAIATETFVTSLTECGYVAALASEELDETKFVGSTADHRYIAVFDPIDGSSNIDVAISIGTIFGFYRRGDGETVSESSVLRPGREQIAAAYLVYGSSTVFVLALKGKVHGFTLDLASQEFRLTNPDIRIPEECPYYSVNEGNYEKWDAPMQQAVTKLQHTHSSRYVGSLVADFHRNLLKGGIFLYPGDNKNPNGKLRLLYEANPLGFVAEQAGGAASSGTQRILDIEPEAVHQRAPLSLGHKEPVELVEAMLRRS